MPSAFETRESDLRSACADYWHAYFESMKALHLRQEHGLDAPIKNRNLGTTDARHVQIFEQFWRRELASALGVPQAEVGPRTVRFRPHRTKSFDVCWPLADEPKILISIKTMQNAYRNFTNRKTFGDSAVLRLYRLPAVFGFFFFMLDGNVARGRAEQLPQPGGRTARKPGRGVAPFLERIEEGGDFFRLAKTRRDRKQQLRAGRGRQDAVVRAEQSLLDLAATEPSREGAIQYDAIAFVPTRIKRSRAEPKSPAHWNVEFSPVDARLDYRPFVERLLGVARFRGLV